MYISSSSLFCSLMKQNNKKAVKLIAFPGMHYRTDIADKALRKV